MDPKYGSVAWFEKQYGNVAEDPWGLSWRPSQALRYRRMLGVLDRHTVEVGEGANVVDYGCATGDFTFALVRHFETKAWNVLGVDFSPSAIARARERFPSMMFESWTLAELKDKSPKPLNVLICLEVIYYLKPQERDDMLKIFSDLLEPGGLVLISSMKAKPPYLTADELRALVAKHFDITEHGMLHAKPLSFIEKAGIKLERLLGESAGKGAGLRKKMGAYWTQSRTDSWEARWQRWFGERSVSHVYVLGKKR